MVSRDLAISRIFLPDPRGAAYTWLFNFHTFRRRDGGRDVCLLISNFGPYTFIKGQRGKGTKGQRDKRDKGENGQREKRTKGQRRKGTKGQRDKGTKGQRDKEIKGQRD